MARVRGFVGWAVVVGLALLPGQAHAQPQAPSTPSAPTAEGKDAATAPPPPTTDTPAPDRGAEGAETGPRPQPGPQLDPGAARAPDPGPDETLPERPDDGVPPSTGPTTPPPPESYLLPPPPVGAYYPGPVPVAGPGQSATGEIELPSRIRTRLRVLASDLDALANRGGPSLTNGVLSVVTGGLSIALGALLAEDSLSPFLYVFGGASVARGVVDLAFSPDPDAVALGFSHMPMRDVEEVKLRLRFGERGLRGLADDSRIARILDGSLSVAAGIAVVPLVLLPLSEEEDREIEALDVFVIIGAGISVLSGVVNLINKSDAERRDEAYTKLKRRLSRPPRSQRKQRAPELGMSVSPSGATLSARLRF